MILDSVQNDIMLVNKGTKEVALESKYYRISESWGIKVNLAFKFILRKVHNLPFSLTYAS